LQEPQIELYKSLEGDYGFTRVGLFVEKVVFVSFVLTERLFLF